MKKFILFFIFTLTVLDAEKIQFQSKLYITPSDDSALEVINDNRLCVQGKHGFYSVDISNIKKPKILKDISCTITRQENIDERKLQEKWGNYQGIVYSSDKKTQFIFRDNHFTVVDISVPNKDKILGGYEVFKYENHMYISDILFSKDEKYAYVINSISGVQIYDISNNSNLKALGKLKIEIGTDEVSTFYLINDRYLYGSFGEFVIIDIQNKQEPQIIKSNVLEGNEEVYYHDENYLILVQDNLCDAFTNFIKLLDISNPLTPKIVQSIKVKDYNHTVQIKGNKIFFLGNKGLWIYNINTPKKPKSEWEVKEALAKKQLLSIMPNELLKNSLLQELYIRHMVKENKGELYFDLGLDLHGFDCGAPDCFSTNVSFHFTLGKKVIFPKKINIVEHTHGCSIPPNTKREGEFLLLEQKINSVHYYSKKLKTSLFIMNKPRKLYYFDGIEKNRIGLSNVEMLIENYNEEENNTVAPYMSTSMNAAYMDLLQ